MHPDKFKDQPDWATDDEVVGYTYEKVLSARDVNVFMNPRPKGTVYPSVYYKHGHRTLTHKIADNVGWEGSEREWLFFGNVLETWLNHNYWEMQHGQKRSKLHDDQSRKGCANLLLRAAASVPLASAPSSSAQHLHAAASALPASSSQTSASGLICTSYFNVGQFGPRHRSELPDNVEVRLLEIFLDGVKPKLYDHPSRNRFRWADKSLKEPLHDLAVQGATHPVL